MARSCVEFAGWPWESSSRGPERVVGRHNGPMRTYLWTVGHETLSVAHHDVWWMSWNLLLAAIPMLLAVLLFHRPRRHSVLWWGGVAAFVLFLPNAPYVVTDL